MADVVNYDGGGHYVEVVSISGNPNLSGTLPRENIFSNTILIAYVMYSASEDGSPSVTSVTDNGIALTKFGEYMIDYYPYGNEQEPTWPHIKVEMFYLINPSTTGGPYIPVTATLSSSAPSTFPAICSAVFAIFRNCYEQAPTMSVIEQVVVHDDVFTLPFTGSDPGSGSLIVQVGSYAPSLYGTNATWDGKGSGTGGGGWSYGTLLDFVDNTYLSFKHDGAAETRRVVFVGAELKSEDWVPETTHPIQFYGRGDSEPIQFYTRADSKPDQFYTRT